MLIFGGKISFYDFCELFNLLRSTFLEKALHLSEKVGIPYVYTKFHAFRILGSLKKTARKLTCFKMFQNPIWPPLP